MKETPSKEDIANLIRLTSLIRNLVRSAPVNDSTRLSTYYSLFMEYIVLAVGQDYEKGMFHMRECRDTLIALCEAKSYEELMELSKFRADVVTSGNKVQKTPVAS